MPVKNISKQSLSEQLKKIADRYFSGVEIVDATDNTFTYATEQGYHQTANQFSAEILMADKPIDSVIKIVSLGAPADKLQSMAEAFCAEVLDCEIQL